MFHLHMGLVGYLVSEKLGTFFTASEVWLFLFFLGSVLLLTHNDLNFKEMCDIDDIKSMFDKNE